MSIYPRIERLHSFFDSFDFTGGITFFTYICDCFDEISIIGLSLEKVTVFGLLLLFFIINSPIISISTNNCIPNCNKYLHEIYSLPTNSSTLIPNTSAILHNISMLGILLPDS